MNRRVTKLLALAIISMFGVSLFSSSVLANNASISIGLDPTSKTFQINSNSVYDGSLKVINNGDQAINVELFSAPYSYTYSEQDDSYNLGYTDQNNHTQISRWITIADIDGNYVEKPVYTIDEKSSIDVAYRIVTPENIPAGGQYAVIFAHSLSNAPNNGGIRAEPNIGMIIHGQSMEGESILKASVSNLEIKKSITENGVTRNNFVATAKIKNEGNVDFSAYGKLKIEPIVGFGSYETDGQVLQVVIPGSEIIIKDEWPETPNFGLFKATWTVTAANEEPITIEKTIFLISPIIIVITIIVLTIIIIWIIIAARNRKLLRSRLAI